MTLLSSLGSIPDCAASSTVTRPGTRGDVRVRSIVWMALRTMSLSALLRTAGFPCCSSLGIDLMGNRVQVPRIDARRISAQVVKIEAIGDRAAQEHVGHAMSGHHAGAIPEVAVAHRGSGRLPFPTLRIRSHSELRPEAFFERLRGASKPASGLVFPHSVSIQGRSL